MNIKPLARRCWLLGWLALASSDCAVVTTLGSECGDTGCPKLSACKAAAQQLPETCDASTRSCGGFTIPDDSQACDDCILTNDQLNVKNTLMVQCACAHCAAQLGACFDSHDRESDGDLDRDNDCRQIVECGWANECAGSDCFCGKGVDRVACLQQPAGKAAGPCATLILSKSHCQNDPSGEGSCVLTAQGDHSTAVSRASDVALCVTGDPLVTSQIQPQCSTDLYQSK